MTRRQLDTIRFIKSFIKLNGYSPTLAEIGGGIGVSVITARSHVHALAARGYLKIQKYLSRAIDIIKDYEDPSPDATNLKAAPAKVKDCVSQRTRFYVMYRDKFTCRYCGRKPPEVKLQVDHIISESDGGTVEPENLVAACVDCNTGKGTQSVEKRLISNLTVILWPSMLLIAEMAVRL